jgi:nicotinamidase-related amidase
LQVTIADFYVKGQFTQIRAAGRDAVHLCVDMQRMFAEATEWKMPWLERVLPNIIAITSAHAERTVFTRFIPARKPGQGVGMWRHYYERWRQ